MKVVLSKLPKKIQEKIPISIRSNNNEYELEDLPPKIQELIREYTEKIVDITYKTVYDLKPSVSKYSDITTITKVKETVVEYLKNYLYTLPGSYPFDPSFGCKLKYHLQTKDTHLRRLLISDEINTIVNVLSSDLGLPITVKNISISPISAALNTMITCTIHISIPGEDDISIEMNNLLGE